ncbi:DgyrCDS7960 [Dimorphilus gyrociliatus]|uniref:DgyrCDS7960 n=1 Tax=Dimorphilus gyrociliatus TaxID=2664684 RepID=A0A7I8VSS2_9ANNE|nr:DgyrCDS7960 [Dimorphilus gyrociliatus]
MFKTLIIIQSNVCYQLLNSLFRKDFSEKPIFYHSDEPVPVIQNIIKNGFLSKTFSPVWWARNGHVQTLLTALNVNKPTDISFKREIIKLPDGGQLALDWGHVIDNPHLEGDDILLVLPGLTGAAIDYRSIVKLGLQRNYRVVVFNKRGHGGLELTTAKLQSFGYPYDVRFVLENFRKRFRERKIHAIGFSAGSGLLVSYLGYFPDDPIIDGAVAVSPGYDAEHLLKILPNFYAFLMLMKLKFMIWQHRKVLKKAVNMRRAVSTSCFEEFEQVVYGAPNGYNDIKDYWKENNPIMALKHIKIPVMCISSMDDPVCVGEVVKFDYFYSNPHSLLCATKRGGHCAFFHGSEMKRWAEDMALDFLHHIKN